MGGRRKIPPKTRPLRDETTQRIALMWVDSTPPTGAATLTPPGGTAIPEALRQAARDAARGGAHALLRAARTTGLTLLTALAWTLRAHYRVALGSGRWLFSRPWRRIASGTSRRFVSLTIAVGLAIVPGTLLLAVTALVWHRITAASPLAYRPNEVRVIQPAPAPPAPAAIAPAASPRSTIAPASPTLSPARAPTSPATPALPPSPPAKGAAQGGTKVANLLPAAPTVAVGTAPASCSAGPRSRGPLNHPAKLPGSGEGFRQIFPHRHLGYGTDEVVGAVRRLGANFGLATEAPLMVGNLSGPAGSQTGQDPFHPALYSLSHGAGRAVDLAFPLVDALGRPAPAVETALEFDRSGRSMAGIRRIYVEATAPVPAGCRRNRIRGGLAEATCLIPEGAYALDPDRAWLLVRSLLLDPEIGVVDPVTGVSRPDGSGLRFLFVAPFIERSILEAAERAEAPERLRQIAAQLLHQPSNADPYVHYFHVEVWCTAEDRATCACDDGTPPWKRWRAGAQVLPASPPVTGLTASAG